MYKIILLFVIFILLSVILAWVFIAFVRTKKISLRDKIGQMLIIGFAGKTVTKDSAIVQIIRDSNIGGVILFDYDVKTKQFDRNIESPVQVKQLNAELQQFAQQVNLTHDRPALPLFISVDYEGGHVNRLHERYGFPQTQSAAQLGKKSLDEAETVAEQMAMTLREHGFNLNFSPVLDIDTNPNNPIIGQKERSFSADPIAVSQYARVFTRQFLKYGVQCVYKHFPGHGTSQDDSHSGFVDVTATWQSLELEPYRILLREKPHCGMVMTAHIINCQLDESGLPATLSYKVLAKYLRKELAFDGVIITDDMQMKAISDNFSLEQALTLAINAGVDMMIFGNQLSEIPQDPKQIIDIIETQVNAGKISKKRIDKAYKRITKLKYSMTDYINS